MKYRILTVHGSDHLNKNASNIIVNRQSVGRAVTHTRVFKLHPTVSSSASSIIPKEFSDLLFLTFAKML